MTISNPEELLSALGASNLSKDDIAEALVYISNAADPSVLNYQNNYSETALMYAVRVNNIDIVEALLHRGVNVNLRDAHGNTALLYLDSGDNGARIAGLLLDHGANVNEVNNYGCTAAMNHLSLEALRNLITRGARLDLQDNAGNTAIIHYTRGHNNADKIKLLVNSGANIELKNHQGKVALNLSVDDDKTRALLGIESSFSQRDIILTSDLLNKKGVCHGYNIEVTRLAMKAMIQGVAEDQIDVMQKLTNVLNRQKDNKNFIMRLAIYSLYQDRGMGVRLNGTTSFLSSLPDEIENARFIGVTFNTFNSRPEGAHTVSVRRIGDNESYEVIDVNFGSKKCTSKEDLNKYIKNLLSYYQGSESVESMNVEVYDLGKKVEGLDILPDPIPRDCTAEQEDEIKRNNKAKKYKLSDDIILRAVNNESPSVALVQELINRRGNVNYCNARGTTPLVSAIRSKNDEVTQMLLNNAANVDNDRPALMRPLYEAIHTNNTVIVRELLERGATIKGADILLAAEKNQRIMTLLIQKDPNLNLNVTDHNKKTALMISAEADNVALTDILLKAGARVDMKDRFGKTALDYAKSTKYHDSQALLEAAEARQGVGSFVLGGVSSADNLPKPPSPTPARTETIRKERGV